MSPMVSHDACANTDLYAGTDFACTHPSYWTTNPTLRLCAVCFRARFGHDPILSRESHARPAVHVEGQSRVHAQGVIQAGRDSRPPAPTTPGTAA